MDKQAIQPTRENIDRALDKVLSNRRFESRRRVSDLLRYLVNFRFDSGNGPVTQSELAKQFALPKNPDVAVVRGMMRDLREALKAYNQDPETSSEWRFKIPMATRGGYRIEFVAPEQKTQPPKKQTMRDLREARGWTLASLAERAGISTRILQNVERGMKTRPTTLHAIASALGVSYDDLVIDPIEALKPQERVPAETDFEIHFNSSFDPSEVKELLTALSDYYRACGGAGLELDLQQQEASVREPVHV